MKNTYICSDENRVSQTTINRKLSKAYRLAGDGLFFCQGCNERRATEHSHIISQKRCKEIRKTELIWTPENWFYSCRECHMIWESYKSGEFGRLKNIAELMAFLEKNDPESYRKRIFYLP